MTAQVSQPAPRKRGRPVGSSSKILRSADLGTHHFAYVRAWLQGVDIRWAWDRYMAFSESGSDLRHIEARRRQILAQALNLGHQLNMTLPPDRKITALLNVLSRDPIVVPTTVLPTLEEFIQNAGTAPDMYSQAEWLEMYQDEYGSTEDAEQESGSSEHVKALNQLMTILAIRPAPSDPVSRWFDEKLAKKLAGAGAINVKSLVDLVNVYGYNWFKKVEYFGEVRAKKVVDWLVACQEDLGLEVRQTSLTAPQRQLVARNFDVRDVVVLRQFGIVPLDQLLIPSPLIGANGLFKTNMPNTLGANNDLEAIQAWLRKFEERAHTLRSYRKEVERFYLWCLHELKKPLSSVTSIDCRAYRQFLGALPYAWLNTLNAKPGDPMWRPFRKQLEPSSQKLSLVIVQSLFAGLVDAGYLAANPMSAVMKGFNLPTARINVDRSFSAREWDHILRVAQLEPAGPAKNRLILLLELLVGMGLRTDELAKAKLLDLKRVEVLGEDDAWILVVTGKRRKQREVPVPDHVVEMIEAHHREFDEANAPPSPALIRALGGVKRWTESEGQVVLSEPDSDGGLGNGGIYQTLKRFFKRAAERCDDQAVDAEHLRKASTHWLRHTFGRQAAADEVPLEVIQQALGHTSLSTTTIYTSTERDRMIRAMRQRRRRAQR